MARLNTNKPILLNQIKNQQNHNVEQIVGLIRKYDDLDIADLKGCVDNVTYEQLLDLLRDPNEMQLWNDIVAASNDTPEQIQNTQRKVSTYIQQFPRSPKQSEAQAMLGQLQTQLIELQRRKAAIESAAREQKEWDALEKGNYQTLRAYKLKYPNSVHLSEIDDYMWTNTKIAIAKHSLERYLSDWPFGNHANEANEALGCIDEWEAIKHQNPEKKADKLFAVDDYRDNHPDSPFKSDIDSLYYQLRADELKKMKEHPTEYDKDDILRLLNADIFTQWELIDNELLTEESWLILTETDRSLFPNIGNYQVEDPNISAPNDCTDIFLFGTPGTGKTCLLMGLTGANGNGYNLNMKVHGGTYAAALQEYVNAGITPGRTFGKFVTVINGQVQEETKRDGIINHHINLVEMSGEEFALRIADNKEVSLADMGTGATNLLKNNNKKVFFIIIDATKLRIKVEFVEQVKDVEGNVIDERIRKRYISQLDILNKFISLFELPENQEIMRKVDAIHFIVTKADMLGDTGVREQKAHDLLLDTYKGPVEQLKAYCRRTKRINYSTDYRPHVFTFSLGKFYLGDVFKFDKTETLKIIDTIKVVTSARKEKTFWGRLKDALN